MLQLTAPELAGPISFFILYDLGQYDSGATNCRTAPLRNSL